MARSQAAEAWAVTDFPYSLADLFAAIQGNPVGTERIGDPSLTNPTPGVQPAANWGGYPVSQNLYNAAQNGITNALGWIGGTDVAPIRAFHGSPYDFNAFDMSKIGTGEGAQAYGRGLYFADNPKVAETYKEVKGTPGHMYEVNLNVAPDQLMDLDKPVSQQSAQVQDVLQRLLPQQAMTPEQTVRGFLTTDYAQRFPSASDVKGAQAALNSGDATEMADWIARQRPGSSLHNLLTNENGSGAYERLRAQSGGAVQASDALHRAGIPGLQYLDQGSRAAGEGTRNYVMFDPSLIQILRKYLFPATTVGGAAALGTNQAQAALTPQGQKLVPSRPPQQSQQDQSWPVPTPQGAWAPMPWAVVPNGS